MHDVFTIPFISTCAFAASILNQFSTNGRKLKTGLYTSPHLIEVRERIRINGEPISKDKFAQYFFNIWDKLELTKVWISNIIDLNTKKGFSISKTSVF